MKKFEFTLKNALNHLFGDDSNATSGNKNKNKRKRHRSLRIEELESRDLLSVSPFGIDDDPIDHSLEIAPTICSGCAAIYDTNLDHNNHAVAAAAPSAAPPAPLDQTFKLHSNPGAAFTIYLDFNGHTTTGTWWNKDYEVADIVTPAFSLDSDFNDFSDAELERIQYIWQRVAEDFMPFNVNVTTEEPALDKLIKSGPADDAWGVRVLIGGKNTDWWKVNGGGVSYVGSFSDSFSWNTDTPCFVFSGSLNNNEKHIAEAITHEVGHTLGLSHDGVPGTEYYGGANGWAPIMGNGYYRDLVQWSKGEYASANNTEDDLAIITSKNGFTYRADDYASTIATVGQNEMLLFNNGVLNIVTGIIEKNTDIDFFRFELTASGTVSFNIVPGYDVGNGVRDANLDVLAKIYNSSGVVVATADPQDTLSASFTNTSLTAGTYYLSIAGTGKAGVYTDYGSLGFYTITGSVAIVAPATPADLKSTNKTANTVSLSWSKVTGATSYEIRHSTDGITWTNVPVTIGTSTTISGLVAGTTYQFQVLAVNAGGKSDWSKTVSVTPNANVVGDSPVSVIQTPTGNKITVSGVKVGKNDAKPTQTTLTFTWKPTAKHDVTDAVLIEIYAPKAKGVDGDDNRVASGTITLNGNGSAEWTGTPGVTIEGNKDTGFTIKVTGLNTGTKYAVNMQAFDGEKYSKVTKVSATTAKYNAVTKTVTKQTIVGQVTLGWKDSTKGGVIPADNYEVGFWIGKVAIFNQDDYNAFLFTAKAKDKLTAEKIWVEIGEHIGTPITAQILTFYGVTQKITFAVRATATVDGTPTTSAVAKIAVTPLKYPAPAKITQPEKGVMTFTWEAPKNVTLPEGATLTYEIGMYDAQQKLFTVLLTHPEEVSETTFTSGVKIGDKVAVRQILTLNGNRVESAVKVLTVK